MKTMTKLKNLLFNNEENISENTSAVVNTVINGNFKKIDNNNYFFEIIHINPNIYLAHRGARICIGKGPMDSSFREKSSYVAKVLARQHESIMEHTNIIILLYIKRFIINEKIEDFTEFFSSLKYCNICTNSDKDNIILLIGGSIRAFIHALRETRKSNYFLTIWTSIMYATIEKDFLRNCFKDDMLNENECNYITNCESFNNELENYNITKVDIPSEKEYGNTVTLVYKSPLLEIYDKVKKYFTIKDVAKLCTISYIFHDISRSCSHQLVRHRNGISQESQRYVTKKYTYEEDFVNPIELEKERYKNNGIIDELDFSGTFDNYNLLINFGFHKEDARAWLPINVKTKLMMTFTYEHLCKFLQLRLDTHAQTEIRLLALCVASTISDEIKNIMHDDQDIMNFINYINEYKILEKSEELIVEDDIDEEINSLDINNEEKAEEILLKSEKYNSLSE